MSHSTSSPNLPNQANPDPKQVIRTACTRDCPDTCGMLATVEGGRIVKLVGDPNHPVSQGFLCYKGRTYLRHHYHPDRLHFPLRRSRGGWERLSWDAALDLAAEKLEGCLRTGGPQSILFCAYSSLREMVKLAISRRFFSALGGVTLVSGGTCTEMIDVAQEADLGEAGAHELQDVARAKGVVVWGRNPAVSHLHQMPFIKAARAAGAPLVVVDPLRTATAGLADLHLPLRPGSDGLLALGVSRLLMQRGAVDQAFVRDRAHGFEAFERLAMSHSLAEIAQACDLEVAKIEALAEVYATCKPTATLLGLGLSYYHQAVEHIRLIDALVALSGNLGVPGGGVSGDMNRMQGLDSRLLTWPTSARWLRQPVLAEALETARDPAIGMAWIAGANPVSAAPDGQRIANALKSLPFVMVVEQFMTATAECAHLILPCTTFLEESDLATAYGHAWVSRVNPAAPPLGECRSDTQIFRLLAQRLGFGSALEGSAEDWMTAILRPMAAGGLSLERLEEAALPKPLEQTVPFAGGVFSTPSRRFEFIQAYVPVLTSVPGSKLRLLSTKTERMLNGMAHEEDLPVWPDVRVHPQTAQRLGLRAGESVWVRSAVGALQGVVRLDDGVHLEVVLMNPARWRGELLGVNQLREARLTSQGGGAAFHETLVTLTRVNEARSPSQSQSS